MRVMLGRMRVRDQNAGFVLVIGTDPSASAFADQVERHRELGLRVVGHPAWRNEDLATVPSRPYLERRRHRDRPQLEGRRRSRRLPIARRHRPARAGDHPLPRCGRSYGSLSTCACGEPARRPCRGLRRHAGAVARVRPGSRARLVREAPVRRRRRRSGPVLLAPVLFVIAGCIRVVDGPPVLFRQVRVGLHGRPFHVVKFRTMVPDAEALLAELDQQNEIKGHAFKMTDDPRLTRIGRVPAADEPRRAAPGLERPPRRDEPRRAAAAAAARGRGLRPVAPPPAVDEARDHRPVAGQRHGARRTSTAGSSSTSPTSTAGRSGSTSRSSLRTIPAMLQGR